MSSLHEGGPKDVEYVDIVVLGAGLAGIGCARELLNQPGERSLLVLEALPAPGGTWRTHHYPGVRTDSDMYTFGYDFAPWAGEAFATGGQILDYLDEVIEANDLAERIRYSHRVKQAAWSGTDERWRLHVETPRGEGIVECGFLLLCTGYLDQHRAHEVSWPGRADFRGDVVHPQHWPAELEWAGRRVAIVGSGATAVTLAPELAASAQQVTLVQRSPSYYLLKPRRSQLAQQLLELEVPEEWRSEIVRRSYIKDFDDLARGARQAPDEVRQLLLGAVADVVQDEHLMAEAFTPSYRPWQQRPGVLPDAELLTLIRDGAVSIVTDTIDHYSEAGLVTSSGTEILADIVVTATGFRMSLFGGIDVLVDGQPVSLPESVTWRGTMLTGIPNFAYYFGYLRHSWTMRIPLVTGLLRLILDEMDVRGTRTVVPRLREEDADMPLLDWVDADDFTAGYVTRHRDQLFRRGDHEPWTHLAEYADENGLLSEIDVQEGLRFGTPR